MIRHDGQAASVTPRKPRGVRLGDLDRGQVYRIGYVARRWEVLGPESDAGNGDAATPATRKELAPSVAGGRHAAPESLT